MCRNIKTLFNFDPSASDEEIRASSVQYVRKVSGFMRPSNENEVAFNLAIQKIELATRELVDSLITSAEPKNREAEAAKAKRRSSKRFGLEKI